MKLKEHVDIMIFIERYPLKRCQGCVKLIASKVTRHSQAERGRPASLTQTGHDPLVADPAAPGPTGLR